MKSRFLLSSHLPDAPRSNSPRAKTSLTRRFELQYNAAPRFARRRQQRRQGQALLLAVLIMLLAALLSAGVLAVVSGNLNQTARIADKTKATQASRAGIVYANAQLSGSAKGDLWRPVDVSPVPLTNNPDYNFYYSQLDKVQGWASTIAPPTNPTDPNYQRDLFRFRNVTYSKFPSPNQSAGDAPKFLVKVESLPLNPNNSYYDPTYNPGHPYDADHAGEIKITSIGLSDDDPNVFATSIAYKEGRRKSPWASALRSISNWNFGDNNKPVGVPYGQVNAPAPIPPGTNVDVPIQTNINGKDAPEFSPDEVPFNVVIVNKSATPSVRGAVVNKVVLANGTATLTLAKLDNALNGGETIQKAAAIGTAQTIDLLNTGATPSPADPQTFPTQEQPNGILANGSLWLQGQIQLSSLQKFGSKIQTSGSLVLNGTKNVTANGDVATAGELLASSANTAPNVFPGNFATTSGVQKTDLVNDGWNKIGTQTLGLNYSTSRDVEPFTPPKIDSATNLARYRALTRNSVNGIYIDNRDDVEKVVDNAMANPPTFKAMTQAQLVDMLVSPTSATPADYTRTGVATTTPGASLEQRHLRGWVGPDEFLARGALVELIQAPNANPQIRVTYDARSDGNPAGPEQNKTIRDPNGNLQPGVYSQILPWPKNGTLFAEGNIRIRGTVDLRSLAANADPADFPSLTVISLNNIYVEGSVSVDNATVTVAGNTVPDPDRKKLMLMAKKNVIVNPTRAVLARTDVQTVASNNAAITLTGTPGDAGNTGNPFAFATAANFTIPVADASVFNTGDYAEVTGSAIATPIRGLVVDADVANKQLTINSTAAGVIPASSTLAPVIVRSPLEKINAVTATPGREFYSLVDLENAVNRRVVAPIIRDTNGNGGSAPNRNRIVFDHVGELRGTPAAKEGLNVKAEDYTPTLVPRPADFTAVLTNKQPLDTTNNVADENLDYDTTGLTVTSANKILRTYNNYPNLPMATNKKPFSEVPVGPATVKPLSQFVMEISATEEQTGGQTPEGYRYVASLTNTTPEFAALPSNALAGIGLRYEPGATFVPPYNSPANNRREDFNTRTKPDGFTIPLATSVEYKVNNDSNLSELKPVSGARVTRYIGFHPTTGTTDNDDSLTVDGSFYQFNAATPDSILKSTLDSRILELNISTDPSRTTFPQSIVLKRTAELTNATTSGLLPNYEMRSMKLENDSLSSDEIKPVADAMEIDAFVYAQEGSWLVIPGDYFRTDPPVRGIKDGNGKLIGSYIDYNGNKQPDTNGVPDPGEYIIDPAAVTPIKVADLNRNGKVDGGEREAALRFVRYNMAPIKFYGAIVENQTAVVADVDDTTPGNPPIVKGAVQDWMDKWATYDDNGANNNDVGKPQLFSFIDYKYDPTIAAGTLNANQLSVPLTDDLIYQQ